MPKSSTSFVCQQCGAASAKWFGKCPSCGAWSSLVETIIDPSFGNKVSKNSRPVIHSEPVLLGGITSSQTNRSSTGIAEFDRVLGGGIVPGMAVLIAGEPGIGKSTLLLELAANLAKQGEASSGQRLASRKGKADSGLRQNDNALRTTNHELRTVLYVAGEESPEQIKIRASRLGVGDAPITLLPQTDVDSIIQSINELKPRFVIVDSVQMLTTQDLSSSAGSAGQVRECADRLTQYAKRTSTPIFFVGHITKEGSIAGPKILEHIVDTVLVLEGDATHTFRMLRASKNRFGSTDEVGVFSMEDGGMKEVTNPSALFLDARLTGEPGSVVVPTMEGTRPILVEIQALVAPTTLVLPRRVGIGIDYNRMQFLLALLSNRVNSKLAALDVFVNVAGGLKIQEPALDLGICLAVTSAFKGLPISPKLACFGEVGLLGEVRRVRFDKQRKEEAKRLGYSTVVGPEEVKSLTQAIGLVFKQ